MYAALLGVAGAGLGAYGAQQQRRAMAGASRQYQGELDAYYANEEDLSREYRGAYEGISDARLGQVGLTLGEYMSPKYSQQPGDTASVDSALASFSRPNPGAGGTGAASGWGDRVGARTGAATDRMRTVAGEATSQRRIGDQQSGALTNMGVVDQRLGRQVRDLGSMEQFRRAEFAKLLQGINARGQKNFDAASRKGSDWMTVGSLAGTGGQLMDAYSATQAQPQGGRRFTTDSEVDYFRGNRA